MTRTAATARVGLSVTDLSELPSRSVRVPWVVLESTRAGMSLVIQFLLAHRAVSNARVLVHESERRICVTVEQEVLAEGVDFASPGGRVDADAADANRGGEPEGALARPAC